MLSNIWINRDSSVIIWTIFLLIGYLYWKSVRRPPGIPPGPPAYVPIFGNVVDFNQENALEVFKKFRTKYGDIYSLITGNRLTIVINGYDALKETFIKNADIFSGRPDIFSFNHIGKGIGIIGSSGNRWKIHRTFALESLRGFGFGKRSFESNIMEEVENLLTEFEHVCGKTTDVSQLVQTCVSNIICSIIFGHTFNHKDPRFGELLHKIEEFMVVVGFSGALNFLPILRYIPGDPFKGKKALKTMKELDGLMLEFIKEHEKTFDETNVRDYIDAFIKEKQKNNTQGHETFTDFQLLRSIVDLFLAGTETTATSVKWAILYFINCPDIQEKLRNEIYDVIGISRLPTLADRPNLHYCEAVLTEILRCSNIVPLAAPHGVTRDTMLLGYQIPKDAIILPNLDSVLSDPKIYPNPDEFDPSRYIDENGKFIPQERLLAFSLGRRVCLGEYLAKMEMFLFITSMIQRYKFEPESDNPPSYKEFIMGSTKLPKPYKVKVTKLI